MISNAGLGGGVTLGGEEEAESNEGEPGGEEEGGKKDTGLEFL